MHMHDKDMDTLFRSKLDGFEAEPSAVVWTNINHELHGGKRRKNITPLLRIAAGVIVVLSIGVIFWIKNEKPDQNQPENKLVKTQPVKQPVTMQQIVAKSTTEHSRQQSSKTQTQSQLLTVQHVPVIQQALVKEADQPTETGVDQLVQREQKDSVMTLITANQLPLPIVPVSTQAAVNAPDLAVVPTNVPVILESPESSKKPKIRGLGGLLNAVIASVDKRPDKIIEFTDTDEGDSITGINLGIIKIKKQN